MLRIGWKESGYVPIRIGPLSCISLWLLKRNMCHGQLATAGNWYIELCWWVRFCVCVSYQMYLWGKWLIYMCVSSLHLFQLIIFVIKCSSFFYYYYFNLQAQFRLWIVGNSSIFPPHSPQIPLFTISVLRKISFKFCLFPCHSLFISHS